MDIFENIIKNGTLIESGCNEKLVPYRIFSFQNKKYKLTIRREEWEKQLKSMYGEG